MTIQPFSLATVEPLFTGIPPLEKGRGNLHITGCAGSSDAFIICHFFRKHNQPVLVIVPETKKAESLSKECASLIGNQFVATFPSRDAIPYNMRSPFGPTVERRFDILSRLMNNSISIYITTSAALLQKIPAKKELFNHTIKLQVNDEISQEKLALWLTDNGFTRETQVQDIGAFAVRGGIVDIYPFLVENPVRLEFWGDSIESIREFDIFTQKSLSHRSRVDIFPVKEFCFSENRIERSIEKIEAFCRNNAVNIHSFQTLKHAWKTQTDHEGIEWFLHWFDIPEVSILDYLPSDTIIFWNDLFNPQRRLNEDRENYARRLNRVPESLYPFISKPDTLLIPNTQVTDKLAGYRTVFMDTGVTSKETVSYKTSYQEQPHYNSNIKLLLTDLKRKESEGYLITILCESKGHAERLREIIEEDCDSVTIALGYLERGFFDLEHKIACYSEYHIFNRAHRTVRIKKSKRRVPVSGYDSFSPGDYVVHIDHGIARFLGTERIQTKGNQQDCMVLVYQNNSKVYVPVEDFYKVQKYIGKDSTPPVLSRLGTARWEKQKAKARESLREMAEDLISLYAKRECLKGIAFSEDSSWQKEFEDAFIYEPTPDQISAINEVKKDMISPKPMDRLVCGDVGFGKTEIAMRAAVKAALDGYQVALLAPTTILTAQHYTTFSERMANLPLTVAALSRFMTPKEQRETIKKLKNGSIDILIGTHRILSKDVQFKNLGLLIIDEEQRFGVRHKEKLKEYRYKVDVLSMTATPIPRTLHMSLTGIRDLSIINTPPRNRLPIETHVTEYHDEVIKEAIENEINRGGQVYFVHNRIKNLPLLQERIETAVPRARIAVAHGQMDEPLLERVMKEFVAGKFDILLSTAIIENGLDIPNVNTIIVNRADSMGLSQLYQLRGRVGRSAEQAYAYFLTKPFKEIKEVSLRRLRALEQYTDLGSGFQIAMRDLEIRGAGNILGTDQHGTIADIGFDLYCRLLKEEIDSLTGQTSDEKVSDIKIEIPVDAYIPSEYVPDSAIRIRLYQDCSSCSSNEDLCNIENEFVDRFGPLPLPVKTLLTLIQIKIIGRKIDISQISVTSGTILSLSFSGTDNEVAQRIKQVVSTTKKSFEVVYGSPILLKTKLISTSPHDIPNEIKDIIDSCTT